jgi:hypothetical protein
MSAKIGLSFFILSALAVLVLFCGIIITWAVIHVSKRKDLSSLEKHSIVRMLTIWPIYGLYLYLTDFFPDSKAKKN